MPGDAASRTSITLLGRLHDPGDARAWPEFVDRYGPRICGWCVRWGLQEADAQDVTQEVLLKLVRTLRTFQYDPAQSFRGWLRTVTHHVLYDLGEARKRALPARDTGNVEGLLADVAARADLLQRLEEEFDRELLELAAEEVRRRVKPATWQAFALVAFEGLSAEEAAGRLGLKVGTAMVYYGRVLRMLRTEVARLEEPVQAGGRGDP
jgi:RNA polymerase sigma factor (sigma-70 family)